METKRLYKISIVAVIVLAVVILLLFVINMQKEEPVGTLSANELDVHDSTARQSAINALDETGCEDIIGEAEKANCLNMVKKDKAIQSGDYEACMELEVGQQNCLANYYTSQAVKNNDPSQCDNIVVPQYREGCRARFS